MTAIARGKTAINRKDASVPTKWAEEHGYIGSVVYDWGCGHGKDAEWLQEQKSPEERCVICHDPEHFPQPSATIQGTPQRLTQPRWEDPTRAHIAPPLSIRSAPPCRPTTASTTEIVSRNQLLNRSQSPPVSNSQFQIFNLQFSIFNLSY